MFCNSIDFLFRFNVFLYLNLFNLVKITILTTVNFFNSWYSLLCFEQKVALLVSMIHIIYTSFLCGYLLPYFIRVFLTLRTQLIQTFHYFKIIAFHNLHYIIFLINILCANILITQWDRFLINKKLLKHVFMIYQCSALD